MKKKHSIKIFFLLLAMTCCYGNEVHNSKKHMHKMEEWAYMKKLKVIKGPIFAGYYNNVHIISKSVGVYAYGPTVISNSIIESPICVVSDGYSLQMQNNVLYCQLCIRFDGRVLVNNHLDFNNCAGILTNRPDIFG